MEKKIYFIEPVFEAKYWGGQALKERDMGILLICQILQSHIM